MAVSASTLSSSQTARGKKTSVNDWTNKWRRTWSNALVNSCEHTQMQTYVLLTLLLSHHHCVQIVWRLLAASSCLTSVFSERPLLKKMSETAMYAMVISGFNGPERRRRDRGKRSIHSGNHGNTRPRALVMLIKGVASIQFTDPDTSISLTFQMNSWSWRTMTSLKQQTTSKLLLHSHTLTATRKQTITYLKFIIRRKYVGNIFIKKNTFN